MSSVPSPRNDLIIPTHHRLAQLSLQSPPRFVTRASSYTKPVAHSLAKYLSPRSVSLTYLVHEEHAENRCSRHSAAATCRFPILTPVRATQKHLPIPPHVHAATYYMSAARILELVAAMTDRRDFSSTCARPPRRIQATEKGGVSKGWERREVNTKVPTTQKKRGSYMKD